MEFQNIINHSSWWERQPCAGLSGSAGMTLYLKTNNLIFCRLSTGLRTGFVHGLPYNSLLPRRRLLRPLGGWSGWQRIFLPRHMGGVLVSGSKIINVSVKPKIQQAVCPMDKGRERFQVVVSTRCNFLKLIKCSHFQKKYLDSDYLYLCEYQNLFSTSAKFEFGSARMCKLSALFPSLSRRGATERMDVR